MKQAQGFGKQTRKIRDDKGASRQELPDREEYRRGKKRKLKRLRAKSSKQYGGGATAIGAATAG